MDGTLHCPLIIRPNSEDAITGNLFGVLKAIAPRYWLPHLLIAGLQAKRFRTQVYRNLRIELWQRQPTMPKHLLPWQEGSTEVDVVIRWENPPTTVFLEMKYRSVLSESTTHNFGCRGYPADQLVRNARVGLYQCGWYDEPRLFEIPKRDFVQSFNCYLSRKRGEPAFSTRSKNPRLLIETFPSYAKRVGFD